MPSSEVNGAQIKLQIPKRYNLEEVLSRIARIIDWNGRYSPQESGYDYMIGNSNDWWMSRGERPCDLIIARRHPDIKLMTSLRDVIMHVLGADPAERNPERPGTVTLLIPNNHLQDYLSRITRIIDWDDSYTVTALNQYKIGASADWHMNVMDSPNPEASIVIIEYLCGKPEFMEKLRNVLIYFLYIDHLNK
jgi:hypothetical protein